MKLSWTRGLLISIAVASAATIVMAQNVLGKLDSDIRQANDQPPALAAPVPAAPGAPAAAPGARVYLGAIALDEGGRGVRIAGVRNGGPAQRAGLQAKDLIIGVAGKRIHNLRELTSILSGMNPGDRLALDAVRGARQMQIEVVLAAPPGVPQPAAPAAVPQEPQSRIPPPPTEAGGRRREPIPPPPTEPSLAAPAEGPALSVPQPPPPSGTQAQIDELRHRVEVLEHRVQELERALAEKK